MSETLQGKLLYAYVAGIVDGEGSIIIFHRKPGPSPVSQKHGKYYSMTVQVGTTDEWLPRFLKIHFPKSYIYGPYKSKKLPNSKPSWRWQIVCGQAAIFLESILPYLQIKKQQAQLALSFQARRSNSKQRGRKGNWAPNNEKAILDEADKILMNTYNQRGLK